MALIAGDLHLSKDFNVGEEVTPMDGVEATLVELFKEPYKEETKTMAHYTLIFVPFLRCLLYHMHLYSRLNALLAFTSQLSTSLSILVSDLIYSLQVGKPIDCLWWYSSQGVGWWNYPCLL